ncbi:MAG: aminopeptidase N [Hyperionvirus sp.]|uniref:Aminopeptidase N n=1 Tax=Hyperionvirus sp. TaxID=2487770 RepID=A0A3G5AAU4_9VIRU|nr:MAG: aminopeptidase N [Hyperionvirus sp.]
MNGNRLPKDVVPINYRLNIIVDMEKFTFSGRAEIRFMAVKAVEIVRLHSKNLMIERIFLNERECEGVVMDVENEIVSVRVPLYFGEGVLRFVYRGVVNGNLEGFYRSGYWVNGVKKYLGVTQFQPLGARQVFPCFDEPDFKATFDVGIVAGENSVLSNMPVASGLNNGVIFGTSPVMSTYLLAFVVGELEYLERRMDWVVVKAYCTEGKKGKLSFAIDVAVKVLRWFTEWFGIDYPLSKLDLCAVPDFSAEGMENWGLITFREGLLFCDENTDISEKQNIVYTICHEIAHQWFGNLVTMEWWGELWLNESMATYFGLMVSDVLFPEYAVWDMFMDNKYFNAMDVDSLESSHPLQAVVDKSAEIEEMFDAISYAKGAGLIRFVEYYLGVDYFRVGIRKYLGENKYGNTVSMDLWKVFGEDIAGLMECWTKQSGYPVVYVKRDVDKITLGQRRFLKSGRADDRLWKIVVELLVDSQSMFVMLDERMKTFSVKGKDILVNPNRVGFFRVLYVDDFDLIFFDRLSVQNKIQLIGDASILCLCGYQEFRKLFDLMGRIDVYVERNYCMWNNIIRCLKNIYKYLHGDVIVKKQFKKTIRGHFYRGLEKLSVALGWESVGGESVGDSELRTLVLRTLGGEGDLNVVREGLNRFRNDNWKTNCNRVAIMEIVGRFGSEKDYDRLVELLDDADSQVTEYVLMGLAKVRDYKLVQRSLELVLSDKIRDDDRWLYIKYLSLNRRCCNLVWDLVTKNWGKFLIKYQKGSSGLLYLIQGMSAGFMTREQLNKFIEFFKIRPPGTEMVVEQIIEKITNHIKISDRIVRDPLFMSLVTGIFYIIPDDLQLL